METKTFQKDGSVTEYWPTFTYKQHFSNALNAWTFIRKYTARHFRDTQTQKDASNQADATKLTIAGKCVDGSLYIIMKMHLVDVYKQVTADGECCGLQTVRVFKKSLPIILSEEKNEILSKDEPNNSYEAFWRIRR